MAHGNSCFKWLTYLVLVSFMFLMMRQTDVRAFSFEKAVVVDGVTGEVLYDHLGRERANVASLTKIMTAIVALEYGQLDDETIVSERASKMEGSSVYLKPGTRISLRDLLYALMLRSGNDASVAIAEMIGGSEAGFVFLMNEKARMLGLYDTCFKNAHGLDSDNHYSSAYDLAVMTQVALGFNAFIDISGARAYQSQAVDYPWIHKHKLVKYHVAPSVLGKTGYTKSAGRTLMTVFEKNQRPIIVVTLNAPNDWLDHQQLLATVNVSKETNEIVPHPLLGVRICR
ncbi:hypothetical protein GCM10012290_13330 [Halolactibacillus alkaliphilus]|uniref:Peptidase S11 D-alanyl-D-alanine carboxypeptidase A N-terminal domain-containing protein n=1 Tax=Halolactibacillus alkaliphilus TaxID=442899 RepID=A0A511X184_9BACI|nr:hypothetical protein HAL01_11800 [Halolactibacillus alkaliphilus]GGN69977.1 hypothetical protein GCM10012290_13330 [Halolactibacillus alkaliphilus]SFO78115.1 D-alanyl-D-alanine carboxypeptidase [Halolactibacillus alkaliphilus]